MLANVLKRFALMPFDGSNTKQRPTLNKLAGILFFLISLLRIKFFIILLIVENTLGIISIDKKSLKEE